MGRFGEFSNGHCSRGMKKRFSYLPKIVELVIPRPLLEAAGVDGTDAIVDATNADFIRSESDDVAMLDMRGVDGAVFLISKSF